MTEQPDRGAAEEGYGVPETETEERAGQKPPSEPDPDRADDDKND
ncbi:hypothetical protein [Catenuloplanes atrovinosus]|uniref:Uncharacterized protein n=1 Tax=Catenuloplanes atrovinosus TaxID=137266 RepID=A0AAE4CCS5_9ACTN|nr:hypothetical protein [Catenuloplanes atrovinosus]MDR7276825.1 hypothetical protein [Catenuloplanes atrovinosus]